MLTAMLLGIYNAAAVAADAWQTHVVCEAHGALLEAESHPSEQQEDGRTLTALGKHGHGDACALAAFALMPGAAVLPSGNTLQAPPDWTDVPQSTTPPNLRAHQRLTLQFAPKTSPPSV